MGTGALALAAGCSVPNPAFDASGGETGAAGQTSGDDDGTTTDPSTVPPPIDSSGGGGGDLVCEVPPDGNPVFVEPTAGVPKSACGASLSGRGLLEFNGTYALYNDQNCQRGEPMAVTFYPNGPAWNTGTSMCVDYEIRYRADCSFESAVLAIAGEADPFFIAATLPASPHPFLELGQVPYEGVCDCIQARADQCCAQTPAPGLYAMTVSGDGPEQTVAQGAKTTFPLAGHNYELKVEQARVLPGPECDARVGFQWLLRRVTMG